FGETGVPDLDLDRMLEAVPAAIVASLKSNTYYFVPLALRESPESLEAKRSNPEHAMVARSYTDEFGDAAICHRNVELGSGNRGVFISTRLMGDRFALSFEFFINVAHAFVDQAGVPQAFMDLAWQQALANVRGETSMDAWESRNLSLGRQPHADPEPPAPNRRNRAISSATQQQRSFTGTAPATIEPLPQAVDEKERELFYESAFSDAVAIYLLSLALDFDYSELREREYPLLAPAALAARLKLIADLFPPNPGYDFAVKYRRRA
ncbi:MAG: hypothetical protein V4555_13925, partial [Acidobacteriota bacterium]